MGRDEYAEKLRQQGCVPSCGAGDDAPPWRHSPLCPIRILNPPPWNYPEEPTPNEEIRFD